MSLSVNGIPVKSMRWKAAWSGPWVADLDVQGDLDVLPSGRGAVTSEGGIALAGTIDADLSGTFGQQQFMRLVGGKGWSSKVRPQHYHSDVGVTLQVIATTTAVEVLETVTLLVPVVVGLDYVRTADAAGKIFADAGVDWWVGTDGVTRIGLRTPTAQPSSLTIVDWDADAGTMSFSCDVLVEPGTLIVDDRFGSRLVRSVDETVAEGSVKGTLWVVPATGQPAPGASSELVSGLEAIAVHATRAPYGRVYEYRVVAMQGDRVEAQAVKPADGMPDILPVSVRAGLSGYKATLQPGTRVLVGFIAGDPTRPFLAFYETPEGGAWRPLELELDALAKITIGAEAPAIVLGGDTGALPVARAPAVLAFAQAVGKAVDAAAAAAAATTVTPVTGASLGALLTTLGKAIDAAAVSLGTACPSKKTVAA